MDKIEIDTRGLLVICPQCCKRNRMNYERLEQTFRCANCHTELRPPNEPVDVKSDAAFDALISRSALPVLVDFWAEWCGPCKMVAPELVKVAGDGAGKWLVAKVNSEELPGLAQRYKISAIPTLMLFRNREQVVRQSGALSAPTMRKLIKAQLNLR